MIRPMQGCDKPIAMKILRETGFFTSSEIKVAEELVDVYLNDPDQKDYKIIVSEDTNHQVVGFMIYGPTPLTRGVMDLYWIAVAPEAQKQGFGKKMIHWLEQQMEENNGKLLIIETSSKEQYERTRRFYQSQNFIESVRVKDFYRPNDDRIVYVKYFR